MTDETGELGTIPPDEDVPVDIMVARETVVLEPQGDEEDGIDPVEAEPEGEFDDDEDDAE